MMLAVLSVKAVNKLLVPVTATVTATVEHCTTESPSSSHPSAESAREGMKYSQDGGLFPSHINYRTSWLCEMRPWEASNPSIK